MLLSDFSQALRPKQTARETTRLCQRSLPGHVTGGFGAQLIGPIQLHVKRQNSSICKFFQDIAWTFFCL